MPIQVLGEIAIGKSSTVIFPAQIMESLRALQGFLDNEQASAAPAD
jgi:hypothetical protein